MKLKTDLNVLTTWNVTMHVKTYPFIATFFLLTACGGGSSGTTTSDQPSGYDPSLPEQTLTAEQLTNVQEIISTSTVTIKSDVKIASNAKDLVVKGNLVIK